jgi:hypothetical protein
MLVAITQDCSILELPVESGLVILQKTQPIEGQGSYAGFMIESVGGLCSRRNIALEGSVELVPVLRAFLAEHPALSGWVGFIDRLAHENNITHFSVG